jgi:hypothetical protein
MTETKAALAKAILGPNDLPPQDEWDDSHIDPEYAADRVLKEFVIIPKADLPEVQPTTGDPNSYRADGQSIVYMSEENAREWCLRDIAVWQFIANQESALQARRDELAREIAGEAEKDPNCRVNYAGMVPTARIAIDRIIALEEATS